MTLRYAVPCVKGLQLQCVANCARCGRPIAAGSLKDVKKVLQALFMKPYLREKPGHKHVCVRCRDERIKDFLERCSDQRDLIADELRLIRLDRLSGPRSAV